MPAVKLSPIFNAQVVDAVGDPASGWKIYTYAAGSSTPLATYTDATGNVAQSNPIVINALGFPTNGQIWLQDGLAYKLVLTDANDVVQKTQDNITGVNDTGVTANQWQASGQTPTYVNANTFTLSGDQTGDFHPGRRLQFQTTAGIVYGTILTSAYTSLTTVTMAMDGATALDSGLSAVNVSLLRADHLAVPLVARMACGRLKKVGNDLVFAPYNGNRIIVNGILQEIPAAGVSISPTLLQVPVAGASYSITSNVVTYVTGSAHGLSVGSTVNIRDSALAALRGNWVVTSTPTPTSFTFALTNANVGSTADAGATVAPIHYIYAYVSGAGLALEASSIGHSTDALSGVEIKTGDATRSLVGMAYVVAGPAFADTTNQRYVRSWFNREERRMRAMFTADRTTSSTASFAELNSEIRLNFLIWSDEGVSVAAGGSVLASGTGFARSAVGYDGTTNDYASSAPGGVTGASWPLSCVNEKDGLSEGAHYATLLGKVTVGTGTWTGSTAEVACHLMGNLGG